MKPLRKRIVSWPELVILGCVFTFWIASAAKPAGLLIVPEYVASQDALLAGSIVVVCCVIARQLWLWLWLRWWSVPVTLVLSGFSVLQASLTAGDLIARLRTPSSGKGLIYSRGLKCDTIARNTSTKASGDRVYVLERCGGLRWTYLRRGESIFMRKLK
jgi:hypothetical protein